VSGAPVARRVTIHGHVQGVFFRDSTRRRAQAAGVAGWVANRPEGTVEAHFEGAPEDVEVLVDYARRGPRGAEVTRADVRDVEPEGLSAFEVR
jgi:acylphosphatase